LENFLLRSEKKIRFFQLLPKRRFKNLNPKSVLISFICVICVPLKGAGLRAQGSGLRLCQPKLQRTDECYRTRKRRLGSGRWQNRSRFEVQGSRFKVQGPKFKVQALPSEASAEEGFKVLSSVFCSWQMAVGKKEWSLRRFFNLIFIFQP
jgi:hypothetical protein